MSKQSLGIGIGIGLLLAAAAYLVIAPAKAALAGPYGGDVVSIDRGAGYAELLANHDTGEAMVHTWDRDLKTPRPVAAAPLTLGAGEGRVDLAPHPLPSDPPGLCSRFYGQADWLRGGGHHRGWLTFGGTDKGRHEFDWGRCWDAGGSHRSMWEEMGDHRRMGPGMGAGHGVGFGGDR